VPFRVSHPAHFSEQFKYYDEVINVHKDQQIEKLMNQMIEKNFKLRKELNNFVDRHRTDLSEARRKKIFEKWRRTIILCAIHFKKFNMDVWDFYKLKLAQSSFKSFDKTQVNLLIKAIKEGEIFLTANLLSQNRAMVFIYDEFHQTPLHWAAKRNKHQFISLLASYGAKINAKDSLGRTPLHCAAKHEHIESIKTLLYELADPFKTTNEGKSAADMTKNLVILGYLRRAKVLHSLHELDKSLKAADRIQLGLDFMFTYEELMRIKKEKEIYGKH